MRHRDYSQAGTAGGWFFTPSVLLEPTRLHLQFSCQNLTVKAPYDVPRVLPPSYQFFPQLCLFLSLFFLLFLTPGFPVHWLTGEQPTGAGAPMCHGVLSAFLPREAGAEKAGGSWGSHCEFFCFVCILRPYSQHTWEVDHFILTWMNKKKVQKGKAQPRSPRMDT